MKIRLLLLLSCLCMGVNAKDVNRIFSLDRGWRAVCYPEDKARYGDSIVLEQVSVPHNFDDYYGARQLKHGNLHGTAVYDFRFDAPPSVHPSDLYYRLRIEGAGTYVTAILNGDTLCVHRPAGRVVTTLPLVADSIYFTDNQLRIICEHPSRITDMPWVCGGCSSEWGFSEGSQPLGLFRGVYLEEKYGLHLQPFGVHAWANATCDTLFVESEIENRTQHQSRGFKLRTSLRPLINTDIQVAEVETKFSLAKGGTTIIRQAIPLKEIVRWTPDRPYLYAIRSELVCKDVDTNRSLFSDRMDTEFGFRTLQWGRQFKVNGKPVFINGVCEYEHSFGHSHALTHTEIDHRCLQVRKLGYNAFREGHQPHNLHYSYNWNRMGILDWTQFSAHIWYDTPAFRRNFKALLAQWVKERRNDPSVILWGLQNESTLPKEFAEECTALIHRLDPTGRLVTTCNGGTGTDWNVVQNWSGTYGGRLENYANELKQDNQLLNGEYGAWRTLGLHDTLTVFNPKAPNSEEKFAMLLSSKMQQAESVKDSVCGQYQWLLYSHDNPGRWQPDEALRLIDKVGPYNHKGLYTIWGQPTDFALQLSHDTLPEPAVGDTSAMLYRGVPGMTYLYRYNCGGDSIIDSWGHQWIGDDTRFSTSWAQRPVFARDSLCPVLASQGMTEGDVCLCMPNGKLVRLREMDQPLMRSFRWGRQDLRFRFPVPRHHSYSVELYSIEPWERLPLGRIFHTAINGVEVDHNKDVCQISGGRNRLVRTTYIVNSGDSAFLDLSFPYVAVGQAVVNAIAIATLENTFEADSILQVDSLPGYPYSAGLTWAALDTMTLAVTPKGYFPNAEADAVQQVQSQPERQADGSIRYPFQVGIANEYVLRFRYKNVSGATIPSHWEIRSQVDERVIAKGMLNLPVTPAKWKPVSTTTGTMINAGAYTLTIRPEQPVDFDYLTVE